MLAAFCERQAAQWAQQQDQMDDDAALAEIARQMDAEEADADAEEVVCGLCYDLGCEDEDLEGLDCLGD